MIEKCFIPSQRLISALQFPLLVSFTVGTIAYFWDSPYEIMSSGYPETPSIGIIKNKIDNTYLFMNSAKKLLNFIDFLTTSVKFIIL